LLNKLSHFKGHCIVLITSGDRVVFSGIVQPEPIIVAIEPMPADTKAQQA